MSFSLCRNNLLNKHETFFAVSEYTSWVRYYLNLWIFHLSLLTLKVSLKIIFSSSLSSEHKPWAKYISRHHPHHIQQTGINHHETILEADMTNNFLCNPMKWWWTQTQTYAWWKAGTHFHSPVLLHKMLMKYV